MDLAPPQPAILGHPGRIIVIGDVHGDVERLVFSLVSMNIISSQLEWIAEPPNTIVIQLGDQIDCLNRGGTSAWDTFDLNVMIMMDKLDETAQLKGGRVLSLIGNHELMNVQHQFSFVSEASMNATGVDVRKALFSPGQGQFAGILARRNIIAKIGPYLFCHGGLVSFHIDTMISLGFTELDHINIYFRKYLHGIPITDEREIQLIDKVIGSSEGILWTRVYMNLLECQGHSLIEFMADNVLKRVGCVAMFIGHNTVHSITSVASKLFFTDAGLSRAFPNNRVQVLEIRRNMTTGIDDINLIEIPQKS